MKKFFILSALVSMSFVACTADKEQFGNLISDGQELYAGFDALSRTYVEDNTYLRWHEDDRLTAFYGNTLNRQYKFKGQTGDNSGSFSHVPSGDLETGNAFDRIYAVYPYDETATITDEGIISLTLPAVQQYAENSFGKGANTMIAVTENLEDTFLAFKNACGYLKLKLYAPEGGVVKSIEVKGNKNEKIAGAAIATIAFGEAPVVTMSDEATTAITVECGEGVTLGQTAETATEFWVVIPEVTFTEGITITVTNSFGTTFTKSTDNEVVIERNTIQPMAAVVFDMLYEVGRVVTYGGADGVVYYVDDSVVKIISVKESSQTWGQYGFKTNARDFSDGYVNVQTIISSYGYIYGGAFEWCAGYGNTWYLPAYNEWAKDIYVNLVTINESLSTNGHSIISGKYWCSHEYDSYEAYVCQILDEISCILKAKNSTIKVRAIAVIRK